MSALSAQIVHIHHTFPEKFFQNQFHELNRQELSAAVIQHCHIIVTNTTNIEFLIIFQNIFIFIALLFLK